MATFERIDPDGDLNTGRSVFYVTDSLGEQVQLSQQEAEELMGWLRSFLDPLPSLPLDDKTRGDYQFQHNDEIEHTFHGLRQTEHVLYEQRQHARFLREETIDGRRWLHVQSLTDSSVQYRVPVEEVKTVSRVIPGEGTVSHHFDKEAE
jgi:hypothetical protein